MESITITQDQLAAALTEWERRFREGPDGFKTQAEVRANAPESYGEEAGPFLMSILREQAEAVHQVAA